MRRLCRFLSFLLFPILLASLSAPVGGQGGVQLTQWQVAVDFSPPEETLLVYETVINQGGTPIQGLRIGILAESLQPMEEDRLGGKEEEPMDILVSRKGEASLATIRFPQLLEAEEQIDLRIRFRSQGILAPLEGGGYRARLRLTSPRALAADGRELPVSVTPGTFRIDVPVGHLLTRSDPTPWRVLWQGIGGRENHFVVLYDTHPYEGEVEVSFRESAVVRRVLKVEEEIRRRREALSDERAKKVQRTFDEAVAQLISGSEKEAEQTLDQAMALLEVEAGRGRPPEEAGEKGVCGPTALLLALLLPLRWRKELLRLRLPQR
jgi:hypothetical protein